MKLTMMLLSTFIVFWNVENFFDSKADNISSSELEFSSTGARHWSKRRFYTKCNAIAKTILLAADEYGRVPDVIALAEIENLNVVKALCNYTSLSRFGYRIIHYDSPDKRGIDCAILYRKGRFGEVSAKACHIYDTDGGIMATRDILLLDSDSLSVLVNHHPSKLGNGSGNRRNLALGRLRSLTDSLLLEGRSRIVAVGDFNDTPGPDSRSILEPSLREVMPSSGGTGTIKFNGCWELIDRCLTSPGINAEVRILSYPFLATKDSAFGGEKPLRTYSGPKYLGGVSDHYPIAVMIE